LLEAREREGAQGAFRIVGHARGADAASFLFGILRIQAMNFEFRKALATGS
jgi:hypothetical protein